MRQWFCHVLLTLTIPIVLGNAQHGANGGFYPNATDAVVLPSETGRNTSVSSEALLATSTWTNRTCLSRTVNYITHTLPQKCLRTDRAAADAKKSDESSQDSVGSSSVSESRTSLMGDVIPSSTDVPSATGSTASLRPDAETDSPLDNANFLSFEEWKRQNQAKAEQAAEQGQPPLHADRQRPGIHNALDTLGDEGEIELDFSGFGSGAGGPRQQQAAYRTPDGPASEYTAPPSHTSRSKDAGKTCKERTNYASFDCAATVLKTNPECKSASSVLVENKDSYMLNTCSANNKFFIVELCNDILIDTVVLANFEFFSSIFRHFRVSASERYPVKMDKWIDLGTFEARNTREVQAFLIEHPQIWARYLRIEFISQYGSEYYCPVSLLRVHGTTMLEDVWLQQKNAQGDTADDEITLEAEVEATPAVSQEPIASTDEADKATLQAMLPVADGVEKSPPLEDSQKPLTPTSANVEAESLGTPSLMWTVNITGILTSVTIPVPTEMTCPPNMTSLDDMTSSVTSSTFTTPSEAKATEETKAMHGKISRIANGNDELEGTPTAPGLLDASATGSGPSVHNVSLNISSDSAVPSTTSPSHSASLFTPSYASAANSKQAESISAISSAAANVVRTPPSAGSTASQPQPSTQESFFKSIHKRLQQLEANSTLSLQYIEEQSRILRDAFSKVEKRQISATTSFLTSLNNTVMTELQGFRQAYDQLWQSTVIELEGQREQYQREMLALSSRLTLIADELVWQKRMGIVQSTLLLLCLGLVLFARTGQAGYPFMQQMVNRSNAALSRRAQGWESPPASPSPENRSPTRLLARKFLWRSYTEPSVGTDSRPESKDGPSEDFAEVDVKIEPPTPDSGSPAIPTPRTDDEGDIEDMVDTREIQSSPPTPTGTREGERAEEAPDLMRFGVDAT